MAGIDPGLHGAVAIYNGTSGMLKVIDMPVAAGQVVPQSLFQEFYGFKDTLRHVYIENVHSMPRQGVSSSFKFGRSFGVLLGLLAGMTIPYTLVEPALWKRVMGIPAGSEKDVSRRRAAELLPIHADLFKRVKDDGRAEAALIALYGARNEYA